MHRWVSEAEGRIVVLLGAGASKPNLPTSAQLVEQVFARRDQSFTGDRTVDHLWSAIRPVAQKVGDAGTIEDVYEAVSTLSYQESDPTRHWIEGFTHFDFYTDDDQGRAELKSDAEMILHFIERDVLHLLSRASIGAPLGHFQPLLQADVIGVATLNYDTLIEEAGRVHGREISTGANEWDGGFRWTFLDHALPLLKLHGSFTWRPSRVLNEGIGGLPNIGLYEVERIDQAAPNARIDSALIFGAPMKLTPHGPFPALLRQFGDWLEQADLVVVAGYSFSDEHITQALYRWAKLDEGRRIVIIDPYPKTDAPFIGDTYGGLLYAMWEGYRSPHGDVPGYAQTVGPNRIDIVEESVETGIPLLFRDEV